MNPTFVPSPYNASGQSPNLVSGFISGHGSPEGVASGSLFYIYTDLDATPSDPTYYLKLTPFGNTGWQAVAAGGSGPVTGALLVVNNLSDVDDASVAFDNISGMTALGDIVYGGAAGTRSRLAGNVTVAKKYFSQTGNGVDSAAPAWADIDGGDITTGTVLVTRGGTGTGTTFTQGAVVFVGASGVYSQNSASLFWDNATGRLGIGTNSPDAYITVRASAGAINAPTANSLIHLSGPDAENCFITIDAFGTGDRPGIWSRFARGTAASPTAAQAQDTLGTFRASGYGASAYSSSPRGSLLIQTAENWTNTAQGTALAFYVTPIGSVVTSPQMMLLSNGGLRVGGSLISTEVLAANITSESITKQLALNYDSSHGLSVTVSIAGTPVFDATSGIYQIGNGATLIPVGGATSSFPAIKRVSTALDFRLGDDSTYCGTQSLYDRFGTGSPESAVTAGVGTTFHRTDGGAGTSLYRKETGSGNTGWVAVTTSAGANPTATVGTSATNGSATTFMRSDGAPAIDTTMAPTMTGQWIFQKTTAPVLMRYDASHGTSFTIDSLGNLTVAPDGGITHFTGQFLVNSASSSQKFDIRSSGLDNLSISYDAFWRTRLYAGSNGNLFIVPDSSLVTITGGLAVTVDITVTGTTVTRRLKATKTASYTTVAGDSLKVFDNTGTSARVDITLIAGASNVTGTVYTFVCLDTDGIRIIPNAADTLQTPAGTTSASTGYIETSTLKNVVTIMYMGSNVWLQLSVSGTAWTVA